MITARHREQLLSQGYTRVAGGVPAEMLGRLREMSTRLETDLMSAYAAGEGKAHAAIFDAGAGPVLERVDKLLEHDAECVLDLLALPSMMAIARDLCGRGCVPIEMDLLLKQQHPNGYVIWHQGAQHSRRWPYLNVGVYLDDAPIGDGCVRYVPRTHESKQDICALAGTHGWDIPGSVDVPVRAGDILVQDMMVLHCSLPKRTPGMRRTIYVELRPSQAIVGDDSQSAAWAELRRRWMAMVIARATSVTWPADWNDDLPDVGAVESEVTAIAAQWEPPLPAYYCVRPVEHPDYPIPGDLRTVPLR